MTEITFPTDWACAYANTAERCTGFFRSQQDDFRVDEILGFELSGAGEHVYLLIEKIGQNTQWVIDEFARQLGIERPLFGYAGIKDRHAITTQWISVQDPTRSVEFANLDVPGVRILDSGAHHKKLSPGMHKQNKFQLRLRSIVCDPEALKAALQHISEHGFPNYFGEQRFGFDCQNLIRGWELLRSRRLGRHKKKSIYLSALRSYLFNQVLHRRLEMKPLNVSEDLDQTGPLWGRGRAPVSQTQQRFEAEALSAWQPLCAALEYAGLSQDRRALMVLPEDFRWEFEGSDQLALNFSLPPGAYATSLLREIGDFTDVSERAARV